MSYQGGGSAGATTTISENVLIGGEVAYRGGRDGVEAGRVVAITRSAGFVTENNLANDTILVAGQVPPTPGELNRNGTATPLADLQTQATYADLGWDFDTSWRWDETLQHPVPERAYLFGGGTERTPFEIRGADDLEFLAHGLNVGDPTLRGEVYVELTGDLDFSGRDPFVGIDAFSGHLDGHGHTISGITYGPSAASPSLGFIRDLSGTVNGLTFDGVTVEAGDSDAAASAFIVNAIGTAERPAVVERTTMSGAVVNAPQAVYISITIPMSALVIPKAGARNTSKTAFCPLKTSVAMWFRPTEMK